MQNWRAQGRGWVRAFIFPAQQRQERTFGAVDLGGAKLPVGVKQIASAKPGLYRTFDIAECVFRLATGPPGEHFFQESDLAL
jgi:hypothetical protein